MNVTLVTYKGHPPTNGKLKEQVQLDGTDTGECTYVVATAALERLRRPLAPAHQCSSEGAHLVFHKMLRRFLAVPHLSRAEESILLGRAIREITVDEAEEARLTQDIYA